MRFNRKAWNLTRTFLTEIRERAGLEELHVALGCNKTAYTSPREGDAGIRVGLDEESYLFITVKPIEFTCACGTGVKISYDAALACVYNYVLANGLNGIEFDDGNEFEYIEYQEFIGEAMTAIQVGAMIYRRAEGDPDRIDAILTEIEKQSAESEALCTK
jgi:hypothetical protein